VGFSETFSAIGDAIPTELISSLSRLRWLRIIARGSSFRFRNRDTDLDAVRETLGVAYCITGAVEIFGSKLAVVVELIDATTHSVVWSERIPSRIHDVHEIRAQIVRDVIGALELHIPLNEAEKARLISPSALDAWGEYHIGLQHMYRFNRTDNEVAAAHFERAAVLDPHFARAFAARSFTSFQSAFLKYSPDPRKDAENARRFAERSVEIDSLDPFGNFNLARTHWLDGDPDGGLALLARAIEVNPNFAQGHYARAWTDVMAGRGEAARASVDTALGLSPLDPFLYAMQATRGFACLIQGDYAGAAEWAERGARSPASHFLIGAIAVAAHRLHGDLDRANYWTRNVRARRADASIEHFFKAFPFSDARVRQEIAAALAVQGFPAAGA
jgi:TolB-like protein